MKWFDVREAPFAIYGLYQPKVEGLFRRMPQIVAAETSENVQMLSSNTSGGRVRFQTESPNIYVRAVYPNNKLATPRGASISVTGGFCFDIYADGEFAGIFLPEKIDESIRFPRFCIEDGIFEASVSLDGCKMRDIVIHMPCFADVCEIYVGIEETASVWPGHTYKYEVPVVFYGSSITQGACVSRPGNLYQNILSQKYDFDYMNLGFSGSAMAEDAIIDYIAQMDMQMFVFDYDHNAPTPEYLQQTHYKALEKIRSVQKDIPILILTRPNLSGGIKEVEERRKIIWESYQRLLEQGDERVHFIDGQDAFNSLNKNMMTVDGIHPNDFGYYCIATQVEKAMVKYFKA